ncbi:MAG: serine hydrolase, partial [Candidatus Daviesbacteria bacterium]|nr:serine hydrolase [Candidatus Daviesbacteria bacterium]
MDNNLVANWKDRRRIRKKRRLIRALLLLFIGVIGIFVFFQLTKSQSNLVSVGNVQIENDSLKAVVENALKETKGTYGIVIKNLKTGESYLANEHRVFEAGSLYKLWVMAVVYKEIQSGQLQKDQVLSEDIAALNEEFYIDPEEAEQTEGTITLTVSSALTQMITISHNYAALLLTQQVKLSQVAAFLQENGFKESTVGTNGAAPTVTPFDIALFLEKLYKGELATQ